MFEDEEFNLGVSYLFIFHRQELAEYDEWDKKYEPLQKTWFFT